MIIILSIVIIKVHDQIFNSYYNNKTINLLKKTTQAIENKIGELKSLMLDKSTSQIKKGNNLNKLRLSNVFDYGVFYDSLMTKDNINLRLDSDFYKQIMAFKKNHENIIKQYSAVPIDSFTKDMINKIVLVVNKEQQILNGELDYLENKISKDSIEVLRKTY